MAIIRNLTCSALSGKKTETKRHLFLTRFDSDEVPLHKNEPLDVVNFIIIYCVVRKLLGTTIVGDFETSGNFSVQSETD